MILTDSHMHLSDGIAPEIYPDFGALKEYMSCSARVEEWNRAAVDKRSVMSYGVHPWYCDEWCPEAEDRLIGILESDPDAHVGEIGLDSKRGTVGEQAPAFESQLSIASRMDRIVSIHDIGCEERVLKALRASSGPRGVILHSYSSDSYVKPFIAEGCMLSVNPRILSRSEVRLRRLLGSIPLENMLLETDAPHCPKGFAGMEDFVRTIAGFVGMEPEELSATVAGNLGRLLHG